MLIHHRLSLLLLLFGETFQLLHSVIVVDIHSVKCKLAVVECGISWISFSPQYLTLALSLSAAEISFMYVIVVRIVWVERHSSDIGFVIWFALWHLTWRKWNEEIERNRKKQLKRKKNRNIHTHMNTGEIDKWICMLKFWCISVSVCKLKYEKKIPQWNEK